MKPALSAKWTNVDQHDQRTNMNQTNPNLHVFSAHFDSKWSKWSKCIQPVLMQILQLRSITHCHPHVALLEESPSLLINMDNRAFSCSGFADLGHSAFNRPKPTNSAHRWLSVLIQLAEVEDRTEGHRQFSQLGSWWTPLYCAQLLRGSGGRGGER
jgi:hypothetical protein